MFRQYLRDNFQPSSWCCRVDIRCRQKECFPPRKDLVKTFATYPQKANLELPYGHVDSPKWLNHYLSVLPQCLCAVMLDIFSSSRIKEKPSPWSRHWPSTFSGSPATVVTSATSGTHFQNKKNSCRKTNQLELDHDCVTVIICLLLKSYSNRLIG